MKKIDVIKDEVFKQQKYISELHDSNEGVGKLSSDLKDMTFLLRTLKVDMEYMKKTFTPDKLKKIDNH